MYKNQLQELAQRSGYNLPSYACIRDGPAHAPRFKATVTFNGQSFESPRFCTNLRQAEHAAAEVALNVSKRGSTQSLNAHALDEIGACKNLLQETSQRAGINLPCYSTDMSGPSHLPVFVSTVQVAGFSFTGERAKSKKQAEKNAAFTAWSYLKEIVTQDASVACEELLQAAISRFLVKQQKKDDTNLNMQKENNFVTLVTMKEQVDAASRSQNQELGGSDAPKHQSLSNGATPVARNPRIRITPLIEPPNQCDSSSSTISSDRGTRFAPRPMCTYNQECGRFVIRGGSCAAPRSHDLPREQCHHEEAHGKGTNKYETGDQCTTVVPTQVGRVGTDSSSNSFKIRRNEEGRFEADEGTIFITKLVEVSGKTPVLKLYRLVPAAEIPAEGTITTELSQLRL